MDSYIEKMKEIVLENLKSKNYNFDAKDIRLNSFNELNGNVECNFLVGSFSETLILYKVIYFLAYNEFRVLVFIFDETYDVSGFDV